MAAPIRPDWSTQDSLSILTRSNNFSCHILPQSSNLAQSRTCTLTATYSAIISQYNLDQTLTATDIYVPVESILRYRGSHQNDPPLYSKNPASAQTSPQGYITPLSSSQEVGRQAPPPLKGSAQVRTDDTTISLSAMHTQAARASQKRATAQILRPVVQPCSPNRGSHGSRAWTFKIPRCTCLRGRS